MADENSTIDAGNGIMVEVAPTKSKPKGTKPQKHASGSNRKETKSKWTGKPVKAKAEKKPIKQAQDGSLRGVAKPDGWKPEKQLMASFLAAQAEGKKGLDLAPFMNKAQVRSLELMAKAKGPVARQTFVEKGCISSDSYVGVWVGRVKEDERIESEKKWGYVSLVTAGWAKVVQLDDNDKKAWVYEITANGRKALERKQKFDLAKSKEKVAAE